MNPLNVHEIPSTPIPLEQIDPSPGFCCMSFGFDLHRLKNSIQKIGVVNAPVLINKMKGEGGQQLDVVSGFQRISALRALSRKTVSCRILPSNTPALDCVLLNFYENLAVRPFNPVEKGMVFKRLMEGVSKKDVLNRYMPLLELPSHEKTLRLFLRIETDFESLPKKLIAVGSLSMKAAKHMVEMKPQERDLFCRYFSVINFSKNQQTQFIDLVTDLSHMKNISISRLLADSRLTDVRDDPQMNSPQKARALILDLRKRRLPRLVDAETTFKRAVQNMSLPSKTQLFPPPFFEGAGYRLEINFEDGKELNKKLQMLVKSEKLLAFQDPWKKDF